MPLPDSSALRPTNFPAASSSAEPGSPAQQAFRQAVLDVENLRERLRELEDAQTEARRTYWRQVGPLAEAVVAARRALFEPLEAALLLDYFSRAEEAQITEVILANAQALRDRFGEDVTDVLQRYAPAARSRAAAEAPPSPESRTDSATDSADDAAQQPRARRKTKAQRAQEATAQAARAEQQRLLSNTKTVYRQLARANHPDLERDPARAQAKTARMQRITEAYEANDLYTLLQLLSEHAAADAGPESEDVLARYTQALLQQQRELKERMNQLKYGPGSLAPGGSPKKQQVALRELKRDLRAEADYVQHVNRLIAAPEGLRRVLRELTAEGHAGI